MHFTFPDGQNRRTTLKEQSIQNRRRGGLNWRVRIPDLTPAVAEILENPEAFLKASKLLKNDRSAFIAVGMGYVLKRSNQHKWYNSIFDIVRKSRGCRAFTNALYLEKLGIPTARPVATADRHEFGWLRCSYLLTAEIPSAAHLGQWNGDKADTIRSLSKVIAMLHNAGFRHSDLKETNVLFDPLGQPCLIDMDSVRRCGRTPDFLAAKDLARLWKIRFRTTRYTRTDALRFLKAYCQHRGFPDVRRWWNKVAARARKQSG